MSRKIFFGIKDLLGKISVRTLTPELCPETCTLWMDFHRVYPEKRAVC
jgi:hypothetical protein